MSFDAKKELLAEVIETMSANNYTVASVFDSEMFMEKDDLDAAVAAHDVDEILSHAMAADEGQIAFKNELGDRFSIHMAYDNDPEEIIYDMSAKNEDILKAGERLVGLGIENWENLQSDFDAPSM